MWRACHHVIQRTSPHMHQHVRNTATIAIRREDGNPWERRAPFAPHHVRQLVREGVNVLVQPSNRRAYPMQEYANAGGIIKEDLTDASVILGVKQVPIDSLIPEKTYVFFSHTIKAQEANMHLLDTVLDRRIRLIDYEKMVDDTGRRLVAFGKYAGVAGMINILHGIGLRLLALGHHTPFMHIGPAHNYRDSSMARAGIRDAGYEISLGMMPKSIGPIVIIFTGNGNVSQGAQEIFQSLPHEYVSVDNLPKVARHGATNKIYGCIVDMEDNLVRKSDGGFDMAEYMQSPELYASTFSNKVAPYMSVLINCIFYAPGAPRLITIPDAKKLLQPSQTPWLRGTDGCPKLPHRMIGICDISADPGGSIEFMKECTTINKPFVLYDAEQNVDYESFAGDGVLICSVDNMPAQLPRESTDFFGSLLMPHINDLMVSDATKPFDQFNVSRVVRDATIASNGVLTDNHKYIAELRQANRDSQARHMQIMESTNKVLILGAGFVSAPVVDYLTRSDKTQVTVASAVKAELEKFSKFSNVVPLLLDINRSQDELELLIKDHDLVISLLPYVLHPDIAKLCIKHKRNMVTASYKSPAMCALHEDARAAGIMVMNEVGLDPGIDHMLAMECFDEVRAHGGKVRSFVSYCGGLPAPEDSDNPLRYKFSWSPRGVLFNVLGAAKYLMNGEPVEIPEGSLLDAAEPVEFLPGFNLEGFPNRDSLPYAKLYGIEDAHTILRGTLRYRGFSEVMKGLVKLGIIDPNEHPHLHRDGPDLTWRQMVSELSGIREDILVDSLKDQLYTILDNDDTKVKAIEQLGLLCDTDVVKKGNPLDTLSHHLADKLAYGPTERDMVIMRHDVGIEWADRTREMRNIDLVVYGDPNGYSAMAATVGLPAAIASQMILDGEIQGEGMMLPFNKEIYRPILKRLQKENIIAKEKSSDMPIVEEEELRY